MLLVKCSLDCKPTFCIMRNWNWNKKYLINCWSWFACFNIWNISFQIYSFFNFIILNVTSSLCFWSNGIQKHGWLEFCSKNGWSLTTKWKNQIVGFFSSFTIVHSIFHILGDWSYPRLKPHFCCLTISNIQLMDIRFIGFSNIVIVIINSKTP